MSKKFWKFSNNLFEKIGELVLHGEISSESSWLSEDEVTYREFIQDLKDLGDVDTINVYINSGGGDVFAAHAIYTQLKAHKAKIHVVVEGICASAATIPLMAADTSSIANGGVVMIHNPKIGLNGYFEQKELDKYSEIVNTIKKSIIASYKTKLNKTEAELKKIMDKESWYTGQEAVDNGFIDELMFDEVESILNGNLLVVNNVQCDISKYKNIPQSFVNKVLDSNNITNPSAFFNTKNKNDIKNYMNGGTTMEIKNVEELIKNYPDLVNQAIQNATTKAVEDATTKAVENERNRLKAIDDISNSLPKELVNSAKYEKHMTAEALALEAIKANNLLGSTTFKNMLEDSEQSGADGVGSVTVPDEGNDANPEVKNQQKVNRLTGFLNKGKGVAK